MKQIIVVTVLSLGGILAWQLSYRLSSDALAMAIGIVFGLLAGVPTLLLILSSQRRQPRRSDDGDARSVHVTYNVTYTDNRRLTVPAVVAPQWQAMPLLAYRQQEMQAQRGRVFRVVGERAVWNGEDYQYR